MFYPPPIQTVLDNNHEHDPQEYTARPGNSLSHNHTNAPWFQQHQQEEYSDTTATSSLPGLEHGLTRPLQPHEQERLAQLDRLKFFLATAPSRWDTSPSANAAASSTHPSPYPTPSHPALNRFLLPSQEFVTCVLWNGLYHITGTDIVRALVFRFEAFGRPVRNMKKFEEGVFSDLRNLKPGVDACLEEPKSPFLDLLFKYQCIRTQKKQKVFYWFSVPHDRLFLDALERDLKREKMGMESTTLITGEPAMSFAYDSKRSLYEQFSKAQGGRDGEGDLERVVRRLDEDNIVASSSSFRSGEDADGEMEDELSGFSSADDVEPMDLQQLQQHQQQQSQQHLAAATSGGAQPFFSMFSLFEGSPTYKQRRKKSSTKPSGLANLLLSGTPEQERGRFPYRLAAPHGHHSHSQSTSSPSNSRHPSPSSHPYAVTAADGLILKSEPGMSAADLFMKQARGELPRDGDNTANANANNAAGSGAGANAKRIDPREVGVYYEGVQGVNPILAPPHAQGMSNPMPQPMPQSGPGRMLSVPVPGPSPAPTPNSGGGGQYLNRGRSMDGATLGIYRSYSASPSNASHNHSASGLIPGAYPQGMSLSAGYVNTTFDSNAAGPGTTSARSFEGYPTSFSSGSGSTGESAGVSAGAGTGASSSSYPNNGPPFSDLTSSNDLASGPPKNHPCPLLSCGRTFKRMEHLKRHLRTHTMERPFVCPRCRKRFSRSDNLGQHLRVHERDSVDPAVLSGGAATSADSSGDGEAGSANSTTNHTTSMDTMADFIGYTGNESFGGSTSGSGSTSNSMDWGLQQWINVNGDLSSSDGEDGASPGSTGSTGPAASAGVSPDTTSSGVVGGNPDEIALREDDLELDNMVQDAAAGSGPTTAEDIYSSMQQNSQTQTQTDISMGLGMFGGESGLGMGMGMGGVGMPGMKRNSYEGSTGSDSHHGVHHSRRASAEVFYTQQQSQSQWAMHPRTSSPTGFGESAEAQQQQQQQSNPHHSNSLPLMGATALAASRPQYPATRHASTGSVFGGSGSTSSLSLAGVSLGPTEDQNPTQYLTIPGTHSHTHGIPISLSAPSHKQVFDQSILFGGDGSDSSADFAGGVHSHSLNNSPNMHQGLALAARGMGLMSESTGGGAVRRHRSMTPSLHRSGDSFSGRRPGTANSMSGEFPSGSFESRGYHPYSSSVGGSSRGGSATNSPMVGTGMGLDMMGYAGMGMPGMGPRRSPSRTADPVSNNMHHLSLGPGSNSSLGLVGVERPGSSLSVHSVHSTGGNPSAFGGDVYRTESPQPFAATGGQQQPQDRSSPNTSGIQMTDSPSHYLTDLPPSSYVSQHVPGQQHLAPHHAATVPAQFDHNKNAALYQQYARSGSDQFAAPFGSGMDGMDLSAEGQYMGYGHPQHVSTI